MSGEQAGDARGEAAAPGAREEPVADLDDRPLRVEVVQGRAAEQGAALGVGGDEGGHPPALGERGQEREGRERLVATHVREVARLAELGVGEDR